MSALRNPGMKDRHWDKLEEDLGREMKPKESLTSLAGVYALVPDKDLIVQSCEIAAKEWEIESKLNDLRVQWEVRGH